MENLFYTKSHCRRPQLQHQFISPPVKIGDTWVWDDKIVSIAESVGKGIGLFLHEAIPGLLIPYGGVFMEINYYDKLKAISKKGTGYKRLTYIISCCVKETSYGKDIFLTIWHVKLYR
jgi:hypothetical protein